MKAEKEVKKREKERFKITGDDSFQVEHFRKSMNLRAGSGRFEVSGDPSGLPTTPMCNPRWSVNCPIFRVINQVLTWNPFAPLLKNRRDRDNGRKNQWDSLR